MVTEVVVEETTKYVVDAVIFPTVVPKLHVCPGAKAPFMFVIASAVVPFVIVHVAGNGI
jgi:hypothetical protein